MNSQLLEKLSSITPEEEKILSGDMLINRNLYMESFENVINSKKLLSRGKIISVRPHTRFVHFPSHTHDYVELIYMCKGTTTHIINGSEVILNEGELLFLSQSAVQEILPAGHDDIAVNFIILPEFFDRTLSMLEHENSPLKKFISDCLVNKKSDISHLHFKVADLLPIQNLIENLVWSLQNSVANKQVVNKTTMGLIIMHLLNHTDRLSYQSKKESLVLAMLGYIEENYAYGSLEAFAESMNCSSALISREIKLLTGKTYTEHLQEKRLHQSAYLLRNTDINIEDIAVKVGYDNISYFHRLFNKHFGMTPRKYRISAQKTEGYEQ